jgi:hypothetical protein
MRNIVLTACVLAFTMGSTQFAAAEGFMPWTDVMKMADSDKDGMLTPKEVMYFKSADTHSGFRPFMVDHFADFDTDGDGMVSEGEMKAAVERLGMSDADMSKAFFESQGFMPRNAN